MARRRVGMVEQVWRERLRRFRAGEVSVAAFCAGEGVSTAAFYAWRRRLWEQGTRQPGTRRVRGSPGAGPALAPPRRQDRREPALFVPVSLPPSVGEVRIEVAGVVVRLPQDADERLWRTCLRAAVAAAAAVGEAE